MAEARAQQCGPASVPDQVVGWHPDAMPRGHRQHGPGPGVLRVDRGAGGAVREPCVGLGDSRQLDVVGNGPAAWSRVLQAHGGPVRR
eukprot:16438102-Heterocapsa_arctica.AAC.1